jgi:protein phosphatase 1 regulatory subunit 37
LVNRHIETLCLNKSKLTDEGCVALAEYIAETRTLKRLDLRENDIRLAGLMALASSLKFNGTLERVDLDREPKKDQSMKDSGETAKRFLQDINEFCVRNKREQAERERRSREEQQVKKNLTFFCFLNNIRLRT